MPERRALRPGRGGQPRPLHESLSGILESLGLAPGLEDARLFEDWEALVGPEIARVARPHRLDGSVLVVHVRSSAWMTELSMRRNDILVRVNGPRKCRKVTQLVLRVGSDERE
ncbi:MAG: DUF721 domain-containing protein [Gemmatimonadetes bacterium]|nr:DUF721 domain-containing protein [Gemmatimonadota bacterium]